MSRVIDMSLIIEARALFGDMLVSPDDVDKAIEARDAGIDAAERGASTVWLAQTLTSVRVMAEHRLEFTTDAVWAHNELREVPPPREPRAMGAVIRHARSIDWIEPTDRFVPSVRPEHHRGPIRVWRSLIR